jgi:hypothetical protein
LLLAAFYRDYFKVPIHAGLIWCIYVLFRPGYFYLLWKANTSGTIIMVAQRMMNTNGDGRFIRKQHKKRWMDCMKDDMGIKAVSVKITSDRRV